MDPGLALQGQRDFLDALHGPLAAFEVAPSGADDTLKGQSAVPGNRDGLQRHAMRFD